MLNQFQVKIRIFFTKPGLRNIFTPYLPPLAEFMIKRFLVVMMLSWCCNAFGQNPVIDSLSNVLANHSADDTTKVNLLFALSYQYYFVDKSESRPYAERGLALAEKINYPKGIADCNFSLGTWHYDNNDGERAMDHSLRALKMFQRLNHPTGKASSYLLIGRNFMRARQMDKAFQYFRSSLVENTQRGDSNRMATDYNYLGLSCEKMKRYDSALYYYKLYLAVRKNGKDESLKMLALNNVGVMYGKTGDYAKAKNSLMTGLAMAESANNNDRIALLRQNLGELYYDLHDYTESRKHYTVALGIVNNSSNWSRKEELFTDLKNLELATGNYQAAARYMNDLLAIKDSLYNSDRFKKLSELESYYESEKKAHTIKVLEQEKNIQTLWRNVLIAGVIFLSLASIIIVSLQRSRARKAKELLAAHLELNTKLQEVDKLKSQFFANISHEFRTPLTLVLAPLDEQLKKKSLTEEERERLQLVRRNANRLLELVNQLLDLSKLEAGKMELHVRHGKVELFLKAIAASFDSWADLKEIHFEKHIDLSDATVWYDHDKVEKIVSNLLANAFKFTPAGGTVTFSASLSDSLEELWISVKDTGKGIPKEEQEQVFLPFYQTRQRTESHHGGTGLGLSLVKELVKLYRGEITLESKIGSGTTMTIIIPVTKDSFDAQQILLEDGEQNHLYISKQLQRGEFINYEPESETLLEGKDSILIVEDNADLRSFMVSVLRDKFIVITAEDGEEATRIAVTQVPNLVLTDLMMPKVDGLQLTEKLKTDERTSHIPVVLLTAKNEQQTKLQGLRMGADDYLTKPFSTEELLVRITNLVDQRKLLSARFRERTIIPSSSQQAIPLSLDNRFLMRVREIVEHNISDTDFSVERMAEEANLSRTQLLRKLKALTGISPNELIKEIRLKRAAEMIIQRVDTVTQIGYAVGFNDQSYFSKCFKKQFGVSPTEFAAPAENRIEK
jgi:signal transduction histidine kinase/DNA-binding response OmpR family regulator